jgi:hypothetical protein
MGEVAVGLGSKFVQVWWQARMASNKALRMRKKFGFPRALTSSAEEMNLAVLAEFSWGVTEQISSV